MSNRIDRSLGVKPYRNDDHNGPWPVKKRKWSLKLGHVLIAMAVIVGGVGLYSTSTCHEGVRCAD